jgi:5-methylcytosine-specific restriction enzyme A
MTEVNCPECGGILTDSDHVHRQVPVSAEAATATLTRAWPISSRFAGSWRSGPFTVARGTRIQGRHTSVSLLTQRSASWEPRQPRTSTTRTRSSLSGGGCGAPGALTHGPAAGRLRVGSQLRSVLPAIGYRGIGSPTAEVAVMPLKRACIRQGAGCSDGGIAIPGRSRCRAHGGGAWARTDPASKGRYGAQWQRRRAQVLREQPNCYCGRPATDVDHIRAVADGGTDNRENLRSLCRQHHKQHTAEQNKARRRRRREKGKGDEQ